MDPIINSFLFYRVIEIEWPSAGSSDDSIAYNFTTDTVEGYSAEKFAPVKRQMLDDSSVIRFVAPTVYVSWPPRLAL